MRILFAHNRYMHRGGEDESREQEMAMLRSRGHQIIEYVVDNREVKQGSLLTIGARSVWSHHQFKLMQALIRKEQPDVLKVDNYFPILSPSIFEAAKSLGVPTVLSVRNYRLICPSANLFREGHVCTECVGRKLATPAIRHRCYRGSYLQTSSVVLSNTYARLRGTWKESVDRYIAVSEFVKRELVKGGFGAEQISVKPNSITDTGVGDGSGGYALYVGRLAEEKGIRTMLTAWRRIGKAVPLKVIGVGPLEDFVKQAAAENSAIEPLGWKSINEVCEYLGRAVALIFPSEWLEPFGRSIVEAYSKGTPVIAADTEPIRDIIQEGETGLLFEAANSDDLANRVVYLASDAERMLRMRNKARDLYLAKYSEEQNYQSMMEVFQQVQSSPMV